MRFADVDAGFAGHDLDALDRRDRREGVATGDRHATAGDHIAAARHDGCECAQADPARPVAAGEVDGIAHHVGGYFAAGAAHVARQHRNRYDPAFGGCTRLGTHDRHLPRELEDDLSAARNAYVGLAVTEIATLRAQLSGPQVG